MMIIPYICLLYCLGILHVPMDNIVSFTWLSWTVSTYKTTPFWLFMTVYQDLSCSFYHNGCATAQMLNQWNYTISNMGAQYLPSSLHIAGQKENNSVSYLGVYPFECWCVNCNRVGWHYTGNLMSCVSSELVMSTQYSILVEKSSPVVALDACIVSALV